MGGDHGPAMSGSPVAVARDARSTVPWRLDMSDHSEIVYSTAEGMDYPAHEQQYKTFLKIVKLGTATTATVIVLLAIFLL
jgi:hypothetical protein